MAGHRKRRPDLTRSNLLSSAVVLPFPARAPVQSSETERLTTALGSLQTALAEQQAAMKEWRFAMAELSISVAGLGHSLLDYQANLGTVATRIRSLRDESSRLETWADGVQKSG